jgi:hypothetical protein
MKRNVDLTENMDFHRVKISNRFHLISRIGYKFPWSVKNELMVDDTDNEGVILTGNNDTRAKKKRWKLYEQGLQCEKCGRNFSKKPWNMKNLLCVKCDQELEESIIIRNDLVMNRIYKFV